MSPNSTITDLAASLKPVRPISPQRLSLELLLVTALSFAALVFVFGVSDPFKAQATDPLILAEVALNILLIVVAGCAAATFAYPDQPGATVLKPMLAVAFFGYSTVALFSAFSDPKLIDGFASTVPHGLECLICILIFAICPAGWMVWRLRQLASITPAVMGGVVLLTSAATGCLGVRVVESEVVTAGLVVWHYLPLIILSGLGLLLGRKIFRW